ncbi:unnamed protein product [Rotaria socialis]|uniref:Uncharacterized protein n=1 Tax=Rotaria socialis TaxID=392032 RepID=A0A817ZQ00_9BILA|nr:unnamed protein product [Rotaria socialis]CAF3397577.1 unnamed protein product [Rotaria socialis]CAF3496156.1 unnamed protein product [Rotaria socialis]CAF3496902.1 unnamed protein product [Rotaria socialis]CAF4129286.1 unnamed protein product [Rotaria socialis]
MEMNLTRRLLNPIVYDKSIRPALHHQDVTNISFDLSLAQLIDVDEKNQIITTNQWITMVWPDPKLRWNPLDWDNVSLLHIKYDNVWLPDIVLYNNADNLAALSQISTNVMVSSEGIVTWLSTSIFRSSCSIDVRYFPFDEQNCTLKFASWTYDSARIDLSEKSKIGDLSNFMENSEWEIIALHVKKNVVKYSCCAETFPDLTYTVQMRRRPLFYVFNMMFPCFLITIVAFLGFCVPSDSGEKVSIGVTTLLSMTVFLMLVAENMPPNSDSLPLIGVYYLSAIIIVSIATAMSVASLNLYHHGKNYIHPVPKWIAQLFFVIIPKLLFMNIDFPAHMKKRRKSVHNSTSSVSRKNQFESNSSNLTNKISSLNDGTLILGEDLLEYEKITLTSSDNNHKSSTPLVLRPYTSKQQQQNLQKSTDTNNFKSSLYHIHRLIEKSERRYEQKEHKKSIGQEWQILGRVIDRLLVYIFFLGTILAFLCIVLQAPRLRLK